MKKLVLGLLLSITFLNGFAQDLVYEVRGKYLRTVTKDVLERSNLLSDIIAGYPVNWVKEYVSVDVLTEKDGKTEIAKGENQVLNKEQKSILKKADLESEVHINVHYISINSVTERKENNEMVVKMTVVPDIQAEFEGGYENLKKYLKDNLIDRIAENTPPEFQKGKVVFKIDPNGKLVEEEILESSGDTNMDNFLLEVFRNMPNWKPAQNATGKKVKQRFEFNMGIGGC